MKATTMGTASDASDRAKKIGGQRYKTTGGNAGTVNEA